MPTKFISFTRLSEFKDFLDGLFATKASLADYQSKITSNNKLSHELISGLGSAATSDSTDFVTANNPITGNTKTKITYDSKGLVTGGTDLTAADIPVLDASKIATGTFADDKIASANKWNAKQDALQFTGSYDATNNKVALVDYVADAVASVANGGREVVSILPEPTEENYKKKMIYLYQPTGATSYEEYIIAKNGNNYVREKIGDTDIQIGNYWAKAELIEASAQDIENMFD